jgi:hypothetical protein
MKRCDAFCSQWRTVTLWSEKKRYVDTINLDRARELLDALTDEHHGVLQGVKKYW